MSRRVAGQLENAPGRTFQPFYVLDAQQGGENAANPVDQITPDSPGVMSVCRPTLQKPIANPMLGRFAVKQFGFSFVSQ
jgi:hypothetical protein